MFAGGFGARKPAFVNTSQTRDIFCERLATGNPTPIYPP